MKQPIKRVILKNQEPLLDLSIIIVSFNTKELTYKCLNYIKEYISNINYEVIVVDNASNDGSADMVENNFPWLKLIRLSENRGFAGGNIPGMKIASGKYILLLNSDAFLSKDTIEKTISYMKQHPKVGVLGCKLTSPDGSLQPSARQLPNPLNKILSITGLAAKFPKSRFFGRVDFSWWNHTEPKIVGWVVGAFFLIRRETMEEIGYLDDRYFLYFEEIDYCLQAKRAGWGVLFYSDTSEIHLGGQSIETKGNIISKGRQIERIRISSEYKYYRKCYGLIHVIISAMIEYFWNAIVLIKNLFDNTPKGFDKRKNSILTMRLIISILLNDKFGKGRKVF